jgi:prevent-host-death family protein
MIETTSVSELRSNLASFIERGNKGPLLVLSNSKPAAVLVGPDLFEAMLSRLELLEDLMDAKQAVSDYLADGSVAVDAEDVFTRLGL